MIDQVAWLETLPWLTRYAWYATCAGCGCSGCTGSLTFPEIAGGGLTDLGKLYASFGNPPTTIFHRIEATAASGGTIQPSGAISVKEGMSKTFTIAPNEGHIISDVKVDRISVGPVSSFTFEKVNADHSIEAFFKAVPEKKYTLTVTKAGNGNGVILQKPGGTSFAPGTVVILTARPDEKSIFEGWSGACVGNVLSCKLTINGDLAVTARFTFKKEERPPIKKSLFDLDGDGKMDILWHNEKTGEIHIWYMDEEKIKGFATIPKTQEPGWKLVGVEDFNDDDSPDLLWEHHGTGELSVWYLKGFDVIGEETLKKAQGADWNVVGAADFNHDGKPEIVWQNDRTRMIDFGLTKRNPILQNGTLNFQKICNWRIIFVGDLDGDSNPDLLFRNPETGEIRVWLMRGIEKINERPLERMKDPNWKVIGITNASDRGGYLIIWRNFVTEEIESWEIQESHPLDEETPRSLRPAMR